ncbi:MAG: oligopeptide/dipeptide ABC transporter ATP-binding protein [Aristaeellaceae bacterium]
MQMQASERKPLIRISNLKQYFPIKGKDLYVRANDGITLDIYKGETLGLVGESGCGKSTLGRTLLQLYRQTDGRTMYYGRTLDELAPQYVRKTLLHLGKLRAQLKVLEQKRDKLEQEYAAMPDGKAKYALYNELEHARKEANDAFLDIANIIGGFIKVDDVSAVSSAFLEVYKHSARRCDAVQKMKEVQMDLDEANYAVQQAEAQGSVPEKLRRKQQSVQAQKDKVQAEIDAIQRDLEAARAKIDEMRKPYANDAEFQRLEGFADEGIDLARLEYNEIRLLRCDLQMIFQDPYSSLNPRMTVGQIISEGMLAHKQFKKNGERLQEAVIKVMEDAGLQAYFIHRYPHQFSGGQRQRIGIARALAVQPKFVVCDEAVSALDVSIQSQIINLLKDLKEQQNLTYMFITHDLSVVKYISDRIGVMYLGNLVELADSQELFSNPLHPYTEALMNAIPTTDVDTDREIQVLEGDIPSPVNPPKGCKFHTRCKYCTEICEHQVPQWEEVRPNHFVACHHILGSEEGGQA